MLPTVSVLSLILAISLTRGELTTTTMPADGAMTTTTTTTTTTDLMMMSDEKSASGSKSKSAEINLPGFGEVGLPGFNFPGLSIPTLPKIFSEVPCVSLISARPGVCRSADVCTAGIGLPDGPCALGLGVCCTKPSTCGNTIIGNESLITSPGFPEPSLSSDACIITIMKGLGVVQVRLDLEIFDIAGADSAGSCSEDVMEIIGANPDAVVPKICGMNNGQHLYVPVDKTIALSPLTIKFILSKSSTAHRLFKIRVTQLKQDHPDLAPTGCVQYYAGKQGTVRSFNYEHNKNVGIRTIKGLKYGVCFRKEKAHCQVKLEPTYTRVSRSVAPASASAQYAYYPAQHPISVYQHQAVARRPIVYLNRPPDYRMPQYYARPVYQHQRPVVYYPVKQYYYPEKKVEKELVEKKVEILDKKKEVVDGLLAKKQLLINELFTLLKIPTLAPLPTLPSLVLPTLAPLPSLTPLSLGSLPKLPTIEELLKEKVAKIEELKEIKKPDPYAHPHPHPAHLYKPVEYKPVEEKKVDLVNGLLEKKVDLVNGLLEKKVDLVNGLLEKKTEDKYAHQYPQPHQPHHPHNPYYPAVKKVDVINEKKEQIEDLVNKKTELVNSLLTGLNLPTLSPIPTVPSMLSKDAYGILVDNDHEELGRGFSIAYKQEEC